MILFFLDMEKYIASFKLCRYPQSGHGDKKGQKYLLDQFGHKYDFVNEFENVLGEMYWYIDLPGCGFFSGATVDEIIDVMKAKLIDVKEW